MRVIGHSVQGRAIRAYFRGDPRAEHQVVILGQMHGDERGGVTTTRYIRRRLRPRAGTGMWVVPTMNPDGLALGTRQNAREVDLNRNFPTNGWTGDGKGGCCWGGPAPGSAPETKAMIAFLRDVRPDFIASIHQPYAKVARNGKNRRYERRLGRQLRLPLAPVGVDGPDGLVAPTLTSWYNARMPRAGTSVTIEYDRPVSRRYRTRVAGPGIMRAQLVWPR